MSDFNQRASIGQAINLAVHEAVALGKHNDTTYVLSRYVHYYKLSQMIQGLTLEEIEGEIK